MITLLLIAAVTAVAAVTAAGLVALRRRRRTPTELRGDWWPDFERAFRDYERRTASMRPRRPSPGAARPPQQRPVRPVRPVRPQSS